MKKLMALVLTLVCVLGLAGCKLDGATDFAFNFLKYRKAESLYAAGDYSDALERYIALDGYKDSQDKALLCKYEIANDHMDNAEYKEALELYAELGEYKDSAVKAAYCERENGMRELADYAFLADMEAAVLNDMGNRDSDDLATKVNIELAYVQKYAGKTFYDPTLKECADTYLEGLSVQKEALSKEYYYEYQIEWQKGLVLKYDALNVLYEQFDFFAESPEFIGTYVAQYEDQIRTLNGYCAIDEDIASQTSAPNFWWKIRHTHDCTDIWHACVAECTLKNNTDYTFGTHFVIDFIDANGVVFGNATVHIEKITPGMTYVVEVAIPDYNKYHRLNWANYYDYIK